MTIELRSVLVAIAMIALSLALAIQARNAANAVEYAGDSQLQSIEQVEAAFPFALPAVLIPGLAIFIWRRWKRVESKI